MPRGKRIKSLTGIYHIMLKGIDDRNIFMDEFDRMIFIDGIKNSKTVGDFEVLAYCLMNNHVHLLIKEGEEVGESVKRIAVRYSRYYNKKYGRKGHLFNNRYSSVVVDTEKYLLNVFHYIHQNPIKAGLISDLADYLWISYGDYIDLYRGKKTWIDTYILQGYFSSVDDFKEKSNESIDDLSIHLIIHGNLTDDEVYKIISQNVNIAELNNLDKLLKIELIKSLKEKTKASNRQLSRILGLGRNIINQAVGVDENVPKLRVPNGTLVLIYLFSHAIIDIT